VLDAARREALSSAELTGVVGLWLGCADRGQQKYILAHPREALCQAKGVSPAGRDPRLSEAGNHVWKRVGLLLDVLGRMEVWLVHHGRAGLTAEDRVILAPRFEKLSRDAGSVALLSRDLASGMAANLDTIPSFITSGRFDNGTDSTVLDKWSQSAPRAH
jgi:hypothetical protein